MKLLISFASFLMLMALSAAPAYSCSCAASTPQGVFERAAAVFTGEFTGMVRRTIKGKRQPALAKFKIEKLWKGEPDSEVSLPILDIPGMCGDLKLVKGKKYLIYVNTLEGELWVVADCGRSREVRYASEDLKYLESIK